MVLIGRITADAVVKQIKDKREVVTFSLAINDYYKPKGAMEGVTYTTYFNCSYWVSSKIVASLTKGSLVEINGRIYLNTFRGKDGEAKSSLQCHVNNITIHQYGKNKAGASNSNKEEATEDLPF